MAKRFLTTTLSMMLLAGLGWAQEPAEDEEDARPEPTHKIKVLENPYDLASFYRSRQSGPSVGFFGYEQAGSYGEGPYTIASYYRQRPPSGRYGYSRFWTSGYGYPVRGRTFVGYRRTIGANGDLFLFAPTFLAPLGPLTGVFYEGR